MTVVGCLNRDVGLFLSLGDQFSGGFPSRLMCSSMNLSMSKSENPDEASLFTCSSRYIRHADRRRSPEGGVVNCLDILVRGLKEKYVQIMSCNGDANVNLPELDGERSCLANSATLCNRSSDNISFGFESTPWMASRCCSSCSNYL